MAQKILLIDDDPAVLDSLAQVLETEGYDTATAEDGITGLQKAQTWHPDLIIMDFTMPGGTGAQVFVRLRTLTHTAKIPIVFISGISAEEAAKKIPKGFKTAYLHKPCGGEELLQAIRGLLS